MSTFYTLRGRVKINLSGVYHYDARGATAECADLFGSLICSREGAEELLLEPDVSLCVKRCKTHACLSTAPVSRPQPARPERLLSATTGPYRRRGRRRIECLEQRVRIVDVGRSEAFGEPAVD